MDFFVVPWTFTASPPVCEKMHSGNFSWIVEHRAVGVEILRYRLVHVTNRYGLNVQTLILPTTVYPNRTHTDRDLSVEDFPVWVTTSFMNIRELLIELPNVNIWSGIPKFLPVVPGVHFAIHDRERSIVVEFLGGKTYVHENPRGVITNTRYNITNVYLEQIDQRVINRISIHHFQGSLPRAARLSQSLQYYAKQPARDIHSLFIAIRHSLDMVNVMSGSEYVTRYNHTLTGFTQWKSIYLHPNNRSTIFGLQSYWSPNWYLYDLENLDDYTTYGNWAVNLHSDSPRWIDLPKV